MSVELNRTNRGVGVTFLALSNVFLSVQRIAFSISLFRMKCSSEGLRFFIGLYEKDYY